MQNGNHKTDCALGERDSIEIINEARNQIMNKEALIDVLDFVQDFVMIVNDKRQIVYCNSVLTEMLKRDNEEIIGKRPGELFGCIYSGTNQLGCGTSKFCRSCGAVKSILSAIEGENNSEECTIKLNNDYKENKLYFKVKSTPYYLDNRTYVVFSVTDISETKKIEVFEQLFYDLFLNMNSGVAIYKATQDGSDFVFTFFNRAAEKIEGLLSNDVIGKKVTDVFPSVLEFGLFDVFKKVYKTGQPMNHPVTYYEDERITGWR